MKTDKEIKTLKFIKRFEGKIRYINRETGLIGALFEQSENAQNSQNQYNHKQEIIQIIQNAKKPNKVRLNLEKIREYTEQFENTAVQFRKKSSKSVESKKRTLTLPRISTNQKRKQEKTRKNSLNHNSQRSEKRSFEKLR